MSKATTKKSNTQLGKGMAALLGSTAIQSNESNAFAQKLNAPKTAGIASPVMLDVGQIKLNIEQPRKIFNDKKISELSASIKENGIIQPLIVAQEEAGKFLLIAGERRLRAARLAGLDRVPVVVKNVTKKDTLVLAIIENVQRDDLNCVEEALAYYQLMTEFKLTQEEVAKKIGKERSTIANFLRILKLPREVIAMLQKDEISFGHAKILASVKEDERVKRLALEVSQNQLSVRELEKLMKQKDKKPTTSAGDKYYDENIDALRGKLEKTTGFHFDLKKKKNGAGAISIKYSNEAEFNDIYEYLTRR